MSNSWINRPLLHADPQNGALHLQQHPKWILHTHFKEMQFINQKKNKPALEKNSNEMGKIIIPDLPVVIHIWRDLNILKLLCCTRVFTTQVMCCIQSKTVFIHFSYITRENRFFPVSALPCDHSGCHLLQQFQSSL